MAIKESELRLQIVVDGANKAVVDLGTLTEVFQNMGKSAEEAAEEARKFAQEFENALKETGKGGKNIDDISGKLGELEKLLRSTGASLLDFAKGFAKGFVGGFTIQKAIDGYFKFRDACNEAKKELDELKNSYSNAFGGQGARLLDGVNAQCRQLGLNFKETAAQARDFFEQGKNSAISAEMGKIFAGVATAGRALDLTGKQVGGVLNEMADLAQQGTIRFHDLADGLGQQLPNALDMAAKSMGMTKSELADFASQGKLTADDILPKLGAALREEYAGAAEDAADSVEGATARMETAWEEFKSNLAHGGPAVFAIRFIAEGLEGFNKEVASVKQRNQAQALLEKGGIKGEEISYLKFGKYDPLKALFGDKGVSHYYTEKTLANAGAALTTLEIARSVTGQIDKDDDAAGANVSRIYASTAAGRRDRIARQLKTLEDSYNRSKASRESRGEDTTQLTREYNEATAALKKLQAQAQKGITGGSSKSSKSAASAAQKAATAQADYTAKIAATEAQAKKLEAQLSKTGSVEEHLAAERKRIEAEYQAELDKNAKERTAMQGKLRAGELESYKIAQDKVAELNKNLKIRDAEKQATQKASQLAQGQLRTLKEIATLSGSHYSNLELQKGSIAAQARELQETYHLSDEIVAKWEELQLLYASDDPFDGAHRGLLKFNAEYADSSKEWENLTYNFGKNFMQTTRSMFDEFIDTGKTSFDSLQALFRQLLKDMAWQAIAQPIMLSVISGVTGASSMGGGTAQAATGQAASAGGSGDILSQGMGLAQNYALGEAKNQLLGSGSGSLMGGITDTINSTVASWFPSTFASNSGTAAVNSAINSTSSLLAQSGNPAAYGTTSLPTQTFTQSASSAFGAPILGAGIGMAASPFVNDLLGIQNNTGSQIGSMVGGLGSTAVLGTLALANVWNPVGWVSGALAGLGALFGGSIGGLLGGQQEKKPPKLGIGMAANLWERPGERTLREAEGAAQYTDEKSYWAAAKTTNGATGQWQLVETFGDVAERVLNSSWQIADSLGTVSKSMKDDYLAALKDLGPTILNQTHQGSWINEDTIEGAMYAFIQTAAGQMATALGEVDLTPITRASDGLAARTVDDLKASFSRLTEFANIGASFEDEEIAQRFAETAVSQLDHALSDVSFAPLANAADGFAVDTMDELAKSLEDMFSLYDLTANISDENIRASVQTWAQKAIESAFSDVDLSFLRVDFDKESFGGLQKAYAATQAWKTATDAIEEFLHPAGEVETAMQAASDQMDEWISTLKQLGWQEEAIAEIEAKRGEYLSEYRRQLEKEMRQSLSLRASALYYGSDSREYSLQSLLFQQANEREQWRQQFGETSELYGAGVAIQKTELVKSLLDQFKDMRDELLAQEKQRQADELSLRMSSLQEEISGRQKLISETEKLADKFRRLARSLEEYRRDLWSGRDNLTGTRYTEAYSQFDEYFKKALSGDEDAFNELKDKAGELLQLGREQLESRYEYNDLFYDVDQKLKQAQQYAEGRATEADRQLAALNNILASLESQQGYLQAQLDALNRQTEAEIQSQYTLEEISNAISLLQGIFNTQTGKASEGFGWNWDNLIDQKIKDLSRIAYKGDTSWTRDEFLADLKASGRTLEQWYQEQGRLEGYTLHAIELGNDAALSSASRAYKQADANTGLLNSSLLNQISAIGIGNNSLTSLIGVNSGGWSQSLQSMAGLNSGLSSIYTGIGGVNTGVGIVNSSLGGLNSGLGSVNSSIGGLNSGLTSIYDAIVRFANNMDVSIGGSYGGSTTGYGGSTTGYAPETGGYGGTTTAAPDNEFEKVAMGTGIYGSTFRTELALLTAKTAHMNQTRYNGRSDWTTALTKQAIIDAVAAESPKTASSNAVRYWYEHGGKYEQQWGYYARGGITPDDRPFVVGEKGPELMVASRQYGVLNHEASMALAGRAINGSSRQEREDARTVSELKQGLALLAGYMRQLVVKADKSAFSADRILNIVREWNDMGVPAADSAELLSAIRQLPALLAEKLGPEPAGPDNEAAEATA